MGNEPEGPFWKWRAVHAQKKLRKSKLKAVGKADMEKGWQWSRLCDQQPKCTEIKTRILR